MERKIGNLKFIVFVLLIVVAIIALYSITKTSVDEITDNNGVKGNLENGQTEVTKTAAPTLAATEAMEREVKLFIDKNGNSTKDGDEPFCSGCKGYKILVGMIVPEEKIDNSRVAMVDIGSDGRIEIDRLFNYNTVWGVIEDRNYLIPEFQFAFGDNESDILIPVIEYSSSLQGVNANILEAVGKEEGFVIMFSKIVPAMKTAMEQNKRIYLKYFISPSDTGKFILFRPTIQKDATGEMTGVENSYYLNIQGFDYSVVNPENFEFVLF